MFSKAYLLAPLALYNDTCERESVREGKIDKELNNFVYIIDCCNV